jgi:hypothetical protein
VAPERGAEIVVGLTSYNDAGTVGQVVAAVREGLVARFGDLTARVALVDAGSTDDTVIRARQAANGDDRFVELTPPRAAADLLEVPYHGVPGKGRSVHTLLANARAWNARACVVIDASVLSVSPQWVEWLAAPVLEHGVDLVSPYYQRHPFEGALTKGLVYPLLRALYGHRLRQPAAAEFACSTRLLSHLLEDDIWEREGAQVGIDLWLSASAAAGEFRLAESALGVRTAHSRRGQALDLATTVGQVVGALFVEMERRAERWQRARGSVALPIMGTRTAAPVQPVEIDAERLIEQFRLGYRELRDIWTWVLPPRTILDLRKLADGPASSFRLDHELWAKIVYDVAVAFRLRAIARDHLLQSVVPLYLGWFASFVIQARGWDADQVDRYLEELATAFEAQKPYLISKWRWPERRRA